MTDKRQCERCRGLGWYEVTVSVHDPACDGTCAVGCPVPELAQEQCAACNGTGERQEGRR